jgi:hypothetical protein
MHFNTEYWDKTLLPSAIQFMTFAYHQMNQEETEERFRNNVHLNYPLLLMNSLNLEELARLIYAQKIIVKPFSISHNIPEVFS